MADIGQITQGSQYTGNAALGGKLGVGVTLDPSPMQRLATFTFYRDRDMWEKKNADDKLAAEKIAAMSAYDITSPLKPFSDDLKSSLKNIQSFVRDNPDSLVWSRSPEKYQKREEMINEFLNKRKGATANDALYNAQHSAIEKIPDPAMKEIRRRELDNNVDKLFGEGLERAYNTQMNSLPELRQSSYKLPTVQLTSRTIIDKDPNDNTEITIDYVDMEDARAKSALTVAQPSESIDETAPWFQKLSDKEKQIERDKIAVLGEQRRSNQKLSSDFNSLLGQWVAANPNVDINTVDPNSLPDGTLENNIKSVLAINKQIDELNSYIAQGKIIDKNGLVRTKEYEKINFQDGLSEDEVTLLASLQENGNAVIKKIAKDITYTGDETKRRGQNLDLLSQREGRSLQERLADPKEDTVNLLEGNALNDIEIPQNTAPGIYDMGGRGGGNKKNVANIQRLLVVAGEDGKKLPLLNKTRLESNEEEDKISYEVENVNGRPYVSRLRIDNVWYDRGYFRNSQLQNDTEPLKGQRTTYRQSQNYGEGSLKSVTKSTGYTIIDPTTGKVIGEGVSKEQADKMSKKGYTIQ